MADMIVDMATAVRRLPGLETALVRCCLPLPTPPQANIAVESVQTYIAENVFDQLRHSEFPRHYPLYLTPVTRGRKRNAHDGVVDEQTGEMDAGTRILVPPSLPHPTPRYLYHQRPQGAHDGLDEAHVYGGTFSSARQARHLRHDPGMSGMYTPWAPPPPPPRSYAMPKPVKSTKRMASTRSRRAPPWVSPWTSRMRHSTKSSMGAASAPRDPNALWVVGIVCARPWTRRAMRACVRRSTSSSCGCAAQSIGRCELLFSPPSPPAPPDPQERRRPHYAHLQRQGRARPRDGPGPTGRPRHGGGSGHLWGGRVLFEPRVRQCTSRVALGVI